MKKIRVLVVDDSAFMRKIISDMINSNEKLQVLDTAKNGKEAIEKIHGLNPDVVTMDIEMPILDGLSALKKIMANKPVPVIMLSSLTKAGADATVKALQLGAIDFITKPTSIFKINADNVKSELIDKIIISSKVKFNKEIGYNSYKKPKTSPKKIKQSNKSNNYATSKLNKIVAIGTSTGGPRALQSIIPNLPKDINASFVVVQHMPPGFTKSLSERLNSISEVSVKEAEHNDILHSGYVYIAPGDYHMEIVKDKSRFRINLTKASPVSGHRPSVNVMVDSIANMGINNVIGVILTGMGSDGAEALKNLKNNSNGYIIAQDEDSCVVFGMPKAAIKLGIVDKVLPLNKITDELIKVVEV